MKLAATFLALASANIVNENCYAKDVDIDGAYFRTNVVEDIKPVYTAAGCQQHCQQWSNRGCEYWVWKKHNSKCILYKDIEHIEFDQDKDEKFMGQVNGCLPCFREGWDYAKPGTGLNLAGSGYINQVPSVHACGAICKEVEGCYYVSYKASAQTCYLKDARANQGIEYNEGWETASVDNCYNSRTGFQCGKVLSNTEYENGYFSRYDIISLGQINIPNVADPAACQRICKNTNAGEGGCSHFTWQEGGDCYIVSSPDWLEYDSDKISGARNCLPRA